MLFDKSKQIIHIIAKRYLNKKSQRPRPDAKHYRLWRMPGDHVIKKSILAKQYHGEWHPGLNAGIDNNMNIYALCDGIMVITEEKFNPDWDYHLTKELYLNNDEKQAPSYMRYIHVIPKLRVPEFKLIDLV